MGKFRKKPEEIEAVQWSGSNWHQILDFAGKGHVFIAEGSTLFMRSSEGEASAANPNDWIIKGVDGGIYACNPEVFDLTYEAVEE